MVFDHLKVSSLLQSLGSARCWNARSLPRIMALNLWHGSYCTESSCSSTASLYLFIVALFMCSALWEISLLQHIDTWSCDNFLPHLPFAITFHPSQPPAKNSILLFPKPLPCYSSSTSELLLLKFDFPHCSLQVKPLPQSTAYHILRPNAGGTQSSKSHRQSTYMVHKWHFAGRRYMSCRDVAETNIKIGQTISVLEVR